jgi:hypothetical protein
MSALNPIGRGILFVVMKKFSRLSNLMHFSYKIYITRFPRGYDPMNQKASEGKFPYDLNPTQIL